MLAFMGPGMILASVTIGNGEIFSATRGGAIFGYTLLWTFLLGAVMKAVVVYSGGRYIVLTGEHPFARWGHIIPGPPGIFKHWLALLLGVLAVVCFPAWIVAYILGLGQWTQWTFGVGGPGIAWGIAWGVLAWATLFLTSFSAVEKFQTVVVLIMVLFSFVAVVVAAPNWLDVLRGMVPSIPPDYPDWVKGNYAAIAARPIPLEVIAYLGALGGGTYDYIGYIGTFRAKGWGALGRPDITEIRAQLQTIQKDEGFIPIALDDENLKVARQSLRAPRIDTTTSFIAVSIFALTFMILGAVILGTGQLEQVPNDTNILEDQAAFFTQISPVLKYMYQLAIWAAFFGSMQGLLTTVYPSTVRESFAPAFPALNKHENWQKVRFGVATYTIVAAILLAITGVSYTAAISFAGILGGVLSLGIWGFAQIYTEHRMLPHELRMSSFYRIVLLISSIILFLMGLLALLQFFGVPIG